MASAEAAGPWAFGAATGADVWVAGIRVAPFVDGADDADGIDDGVDDGADVDDFAAGVTSGRTRPVTCSATFWTCFCRLATCFGPSCSTANLPNMRATATCW